MLSTTTVTTEATDAEGIALELRLTNGFGRPALVAAFAQVEDKADWKAPIAAVIPAADREVVAAAIEFFTATTARFTPVFGKPGSLFVEAAGYRNGPAA